MPQPFRFLHAGDLHLERPPRGLAEVPDHLRGTLVDAPYRAAERIFDAALKELVEFLVLAGDVIDPLASGPRGLVFLTEQFQRLAAQNITVYWAGGRSDDFERWVEAWPVADHVVRFPLRRVERHVHRRGGERVAEILGASAQQRKSVRAAEFQAADGELFSVAVAYGLAEAESLTEGTVNYWALGGEHDRRTLLSGQTTAHYCGTPQGRRPQEVGPRGCTLVEVDESRRVRTSFLATDAVRYLRERVVLNESATSDQLYQVVQERLAELAGDPFGPDLLIHWTIAGCESLAAELRRGKLSADFVARLRAERGSSKPAAWTIAIEPEHTDAIAAGSFDEESVLGEFLRTVRSYVEHPEAALDLEPYLAEKHLAGSLGGAVAMEEPAVRRRVLAEAARLGVELLAPQERGS